MRPTPNTTKKQVIFFLIDVFRPVYYILAFFLPLIWKVFFSWWLGPLLDHHFDQLFEAEIRQAAPFLFDLFGGKVRQPPQPEPKGSQIERVCIATENIIFQFSRWHREDYKVLVSPAFLPNNSYDLIDALRVADPVDQTISSPKAYSWPLFARLLEPRYHLLEIAFNRDNFVDTEKKLAELRLGKTG
ncbi:MAG: hypothetical protein ABSG77_10290 [Candidatus Acidiferrum sp.]